MTLKPDFQNSLQSFVYSNLPMLMNPTNARNVVVTNVIISTPATNTPPVLFISPEVLQALQSYTLNNFPDIGLPNDIQEVAKNFFANLPPLTLITPTVATATTTTTVTTTPTP